MAHSHSAGWRSGDWHRPIINIPFTGVPLAFSSFLFFIIFFLFSVLLTFKFFFFSSFFLSFLSFLFFYSLSLLFNSLSSEYARSCNVYR